MPQRHFTRADLEAYWNEYWGKQANYKLESVKLLSDVTPAIWQIEYSVTYPNGDFFYHDVLITEAEGPKGPYLTIVPAITVPEQCASIEEEDAEMARRRAEWTKEWQQQQWEREHGA